MLASSRARQTQSVDYNCLCISILKARKLVSSSDGDVNAVVQIKCGWSSFQTEPASKTTNPRFSRKFYVSLSEKIQRETLLVEVLDNMGLGLRQQIGNVSLECANIIAEIKRTEGFVKKWYKLEKPMIKRVMDPSAYQSNPEEQECGELQLKFSLAQVDESKFALNEGEFSDADEEVQVKVDVDRQFATKKMESELKGFTKDVQALEQRLEEIVEGDYMINVHILEARDIQPQNDQSREASPLVKVECFGQQQHTRTIRSANNAIFDAYLHFSTSQASRESLTTGNVLITCQDAAVSSKVVDVGKWQCDFAFLYFRPNREMWREWIALTLSDAVEKDQDSQNHIRGYLLVSVTVIGPGEAAVVHDAEETLKPSVFSRNNCLLSPTLKQELRFLVVSIYAAEGLPAQEYVMGMNGIDAYMKVRFGSNDQHTKTRVVSKKERGAETFDLEFNEQIWIPFLFPTVLETLMLVACDTNFGDEVIATSSMFHLSIIRKYPALHQHFWINLYGAPAAVSSDASKGMNRGLVEQSAYRGRILVSLKEIGASEHSMENQLHIKRISPLVKKPTLESYLLKINIFMGSQIPIYMLHSSKFKVKVAWGPYETSTESAVARNGMVTWSQGMLEIAAKYPAFNNITLLERTQFSPIPDIFVYLARENMVKNALIGETDWTSICYARVPFHEVHVQEGSGFALTPKWLRLTADPAIAAVDKSMFPGLILMGMAGGTFSTANVRVPPPEPVIADTPYRLIVHLHAGRNLLPSDDSGLLDPYVILMFAGQTQKSETKIQTRAPVWEDVFTFDVDLPQEQYFPELIVEVKDFDRWAGDDSTGFIHVPVTRKNVRFCEGSNTSVLQPTWFPLQFQKTGDTMGELLLAFELIKKDSSQAVLPKPEFQHLPKVAYQLDIIALGCKELSGRPSKTYVEIRYGPSPNEVFTTSPSKKPLPESCHFGEHFQDTILLPEDVSFAPYFNIQVYDSGGLGGPRLLGQATIPMDSKIPYTTGGAPNPTYQKPLSKATHSFGPLEVASQMKRELSQRTLSAKGKQKKKTSSHHGFEGLEYIKGRQILSYDLEDDLKPPFEMYPVFLGNANKVGSDALIHNYRCTGAFKGIVMITDPAKNVKPTIIRELKNKEMFRVRIYMLTAYVYAPPSSGKPVVTVSIGNKKLSQQTRMQDETQSIADEFGLDPNASILGSQKRPASLPVLKLQQGSTDPSTGKYSLFKLYEFDVELPGAPLLKIGLRDQQSFSSSILGETTVDLEDRWFSPEWKRIGAEKASEGVLLKPVETRSLWIPTSQSVQGTVQMWVDIIPESAISRFPPIEIQAPEPTEFEVRLIIYKVEIDLPKEYLDVILLKNLFVQAWIGQSRPQKTDVHRDVQNGRAAFNWRMKFPKVLPTDLFGESRLFVQVWDKEDSSFGNDECVCEFMHELSSAFAKAVATKEAIECFSGRTEQFDAPEPQKIINRGLQENDVELGEASMHGGALFDGGMPEQKQTELVPLLRGRKSTKVPASTKMEGKRHNKRKKAAAGVMRSALRTVLDLDAAPHDSKWFDLHKRDEGTGIDKTIGKILVSCEILPKEVAETRPAGFGRNEPNSNPELAEPWGRPPSLKNSFSPIYIVRNLINDPSYKIYCVYAIVGCVLLNLTIMLVYFGLACLAVWVVLKSWDWKNLT